jgi:hypothetical protein
MLGETELPGCCPDGTGDGRAEAVSIALYCLAALVLAAALACARKVTRAPTMNRYTLWLALTVAGIYSSSAAAMLAGRQR